jgi:hypothetical protein
MQLCVPTGVFKVRLNVPSYADTTSSSLHDFIASTAFIQLNSLCNIQSLSLQKAIISKCRFLALHCAFQSPYGYTLVHPVVIDSLQRPAVISSRGNNLFFWVPSNKEETVLQGMINKLTETGRCYGMEMNVGEKIM